MKVAIMGAGAQGCFFGACLAKAGNDVTFIARGKNLETLRTTGIKIKSKQLGDFNLSINATDAPNDVGPVDLILFCVKTYDLDTAAEQMRPLIGANTTIIPIQNGVEATDHIARIIGKEHVLGGASFVNASIQEPGVIVHGGNLQLSFGEPEGGSSQRVKRMEEALRSAGLEPDPSPRIESVIWEKFIFNTAVSGVHSITRLPCEPVKNCPETFSFLRSAMEETYAVAKACDIMVADDVIDKCIESYKKYSPWARPAMMIDLTLGRRLELEALSGSVIRLGEKHEVPTPIHRVIYAALKPFVDGAPKIPTPP